MALKGEVGSGVGEWGKHCSDCWFLWSFCVFGCISVVVEGAFVRNCRGMGLCKVGVVGWSVGDDYVGVTGTLVTGWRGVGREGEGRVREMVRKDRMSC
jgi:hypothetical protein